jgi:hypothetical protein
MANPNRQALLRGRGYPKAKKWFPWVTVVLSFAAGSFLTARLIQLRQVRADSNRVFELNIYHAVPGKVPKLEERFRSASKLLAQHNLDVIGYWVPGDDGAFPNTFIYMVAAPSREEMQKNWDEFHADPAFQEYVKSEHAEKLIEKVDSTFMRPADYSALR